MKLSRLLIMSYIFMNLSLALSFAETIQISNGEWAPYMSAKLKEFGVISHIVTEAFKQEGVTVEYQFYPWKRAFKLAEEGMVQGTIIWGYREDRLKDFIYSDAVFSPKYVFFHLKDHAFDWKTIEDLKGQRIGLPLGYNFGKAMTKAEKDKAYSFVRAKDSETNFKKLLLKRLDLVLEAKEVGYYMLRTQFKQEDITAITHHPRAVTEKDFHHVLFSKKIKDNVKYVKFFNNGLKKLKKKGLFDQFFRDSQAGKYLSP